MIEFEAKRSPKDYYHTIDICNLNFRQHTHRSYEMVFVKEGILKVQIENIEFITQKNVCRFRLQLQLYFRHFQKKFWHEFF